jgi:hypothetical protein
MRFLKERSFAISIQTMFWLTNDSLVEHNSPPQHDCAVIYYSTNIYKNILWKGFKSIMMYNISETADGTISAVLILSRR